MGTVLLWYVGVTLVLAALLVTVSCVQLVARYSRRREPPSVHHGGQGQGGAHQGRDAA